MTDSWLKNCRITAEAGCGSTQGGLLLAMLLSLPGDRASLGRLFLDIFERD